MCPSLTGRRSAGGGGGGGHVNAAVSRPPVGGRYLTDVGADAGLPEALAAELHRHLSTHRVLLTDLLKCLLPNNQPVNY